MDGQIILYRSVVQDVQLAFVRSNSLNMGCFPNPTQALCIITNRKDVSCENNSSDN